MPTYLYECTRCGEFEHPQSITEPALTRCPACGAPARRLISGGTGFIMKGRGASGSHCEKETPCCGSATRCDKPPCGK
jgi:putative FmdB family regulatory protein